MRNIVSLICSCPIHFGDSGYVDNNLIFQCVNDHYLNFHQLIHPIDYWGLIAQINNYSIYIDFSSNTSNIGRTTLNTCDLDEIEVWLLMQ